MVKNRVGSLSWLRKQIEDADTDLLREMVKAVTDVFMSVEARCLCATRRRPGPGPRSGRHEQVSGWPRSSIRWQKASATARWMMGRTRSFRSMRSLNVVVKADGR